MIEVEKTTLEYRDAYSDKVYIAILYKLDNDQYQVIFKYGRRGNVNNEVKKPVMSFGDAQGVYQKQINQKLAKGYVKQ